MYDDIFNIGDLVCFSGSREYIGIIVEFVDREHYFVHWLHTNRKDFVAAHYSYLSKVS